MTPVITRQGDSPIILGQPHGGTYVPDDLAARLNARGQGLDDTDWHITRLYDGLLPTATVVQATFQRYVIDANRDPQGVSLYPGQNTTSLCPLTDFDGQPIWQDGQDPSADEIEARRLTFHAPYHAALATQIARVKQQHGFAILFDCHSIRSNIPFLFDGTLPIFSIGTDAGKTCDPLIEKTTREICAAAPDYDHVVNGRFKGGWTTRHYGKPKTGIHAIQMELAQRAYMDEAAPWTYRNDLAANIRRPLSQILQSLNSLPL
ncbi:MAG: N-formylglutamate deformylase [Marinosulfonomonas sp.]|nr:MAG: N-formylglutamate deformylase [Marinosulfonomonas sp.]